MSAERCPRGHEREMTLHFSRFCDACGLAWLESEWASSNPEQRYANRLEAAYQEVKQARLSAEAQAEKAAQIDAIRALVTAHGQTAADINRAIRKVLKL